MAKSNPVPFSSCLTWAAPAIGQNINPYPGYNPVTPIGANLPEPGQGTWTVSPYMLQTRWDDRPECLGGPVWGIASAEVFSPASPWGATAGDKWFGTNGGWSYSMRAYAQSPAGDHTSNWSQPFSGTTSGATTQAPGTPTVTMTTDGGVSLSWSGSSSGVYGIFGGDFNGRTVFRIVPPFMTSTYFPPSELVSAPWQFGVMAQGAGNWSLPAMSGIIEVRNPLPVTGLSAYLGDAKNEIRLSWGNTRDETGYRIDRREVHPTTTAWAEVGREGADTNTYKESLPADFAGKKYEYRVIAFDERTEAAASPSAEASGIALQSVTFGGTGFQTIMRDSGSAAYGGPQWHDGNWDGTIQAGGLAQEYSNGTIDNSVLFDEWLYPVSYVRSTSGSPSRIAAEAAFAFSCEAGDGWLLKGEGSAPGGSFTLDYATNLESSGTTVSAWLNTGTDLPSTIQSGKVSIQWKLTTDGGGSWFVVGTSENHIYITGTSAAEAFETVLDLGCSSAAGLKPDSDAERKTIAEAVYGPFSAGACAVRVDRTMMSYDAGTGVPDTAPAMLAHADGIGQCTAWSDLLKLCLRAQGVQARTDLMVVRGLPDANGQTAYGWTFQLDDNSVAGDRWFDLHAIVSITYDVVDPVTGALLGRYLYFDPSFGGEVIYGTTREDAQAAYEQRIRAFRLYFEPSPPFERLNTEAPELEWGWSQ